MGSTIDRPEQKKTSLPTIALTATGHKIAKLKDEKRLSITDLKSLLGFDSPQAIYKWLRGSTLPSIDNLVSLSVIFEVPIDSILVLKCPR